MNPFEAFIEDAAQQIAERASEKLLVILEARAATRSASELLTADQAGKRIKLSGRTVRELVRAGLITRAPGLEDIRISEAALLEYARPLTTTKGPRK